MITVYWSPWYRDVNIYKENYLCYHDIDSVYSDLVKNKNEENISDNFFNCYAFKDTLKNMYCLRNPYSIDVTYQHGRTFSNHPKKVGFDLAMTSLVKQSSVKNSLTINYCVNWIFFTEETLKIQTMHPSMHKTHLTDTAYYVPGSFDISQWFRPVEGAYQLFPGESTLKVNEGDPLMYIKFLTNEKIELKRFYLTQDLIDMSLSCTQLKNFKSFKGLDYLYKVFNKSLLRNKVLKEIKNNVI